MLLFILSLFIATPVNAQPSTHTIINTEWGPKPITLQGISSNLNPSLAKPKPELDYSKGIIPFEQSSSAVYLNSSVPILDQGQFGTCVTFATTAAVDATLGIGDTINQQCTLELVKLLGEDLWNGAWKSPQLLDPLKQYGAVAQGNCGPHYYPNPAAKISLEAYKALVDPNIAVSKVQYSYKEPFKLEELKAALSAKHYVSFGFGLLADSSVGVQGFDLQINNQVKHGGLWACKQPSDFKNYCADIQAGHEVFAIGYDDAQHLIKVQNSWNVSSGDSGFYYMTYEFYNAMQWNATEIWSN